jgi:NADPH2:quinone reductase
MAVSFGQSSGAVPAFEPLLLSQKGSIFFTRPSLQHYISDRKELEWRASDIFRWIAEKKLVLRAEHEYQLAYAAQAHRDLEGRQTTGKLILLI